MCIKLTNMRIQYSEKLNFRNKVSNMYYFIDNIIGLNKTNIFDTSKLNTRKRLRSICIYK